MLSDSGMRYYVPHPLNDEPFAVLLPDVLVLDEISLGIIVLCV